MHFISNFVNRVGSCRILLLVDRKMDIFYIAKHDGFDLDAIKAGIIIWREVELVPIKAISILT